MTSTEHRPPLQAVAPPQHDDGMAWQRDRQRFAAFLTAKDLVLGYTRTATAVVAGWPRGCAWMGCSRWCAAPTAGCWALPQ